MPRVSELRGRLSAQIADPLYRSAYSLMLNVLMTSALGFGFWILAARLFSTQLVGRGSALVAAMALISAVCQLNLASAILRFLPVTKMRPDRVVLGAYAVTASLSALGGIAFVLLGPIVSKEYQFLRDDLLLSILYAFAVAAWSVFALQDAVLTALRRATWVPIENTAFGVMKIAALVLLLFLGAKQPVFIGWAIPMILLVIPVNYLIFTRFIPERPRVHSELSPIERFGWRGLGHFLAQDYLAWICYEGCQTMLPVLVVALLSGSQGAYFYMPFTIVTAFDLLCVNIGSSFTVEASMASSDLPPLLRRTVKRFTGVLVGGALVLVAGANLILLPFGSEYASAGAPVLRLLAAASIFRALIALFCAVCRVEGRASRILLVQAAAFALTVSLTLALTASRGLTGTGLAWLAANLLVALACAPRIVHLYREGASIPVQASGSAHS